MPALFQAHRLIPVRFFFWRTQMQHCRTCHWFKPETAGEAVGVNGHCFINPPTIIAMPAQMPAPKVTSRLAPRSEQQVGIFPTSVRPYVQETDGCSQWKSGQMH
jgi:hypothetical protein